MRIIEVKINGSYLARDSQNAGVQGEANASALRIEFDPGWDGLAKTLTWWNARGENEVKRILTADLLEDIAAGGRVYLAPIPGEALTEPGKCRFAVDGYINGKRMRSVYSELVVKPAGGYGQTAENDPTPTQAEQLQTQIEGIMETLQQGVALSGDQKFVPLREEWEDYADAMAEGVASYFCNMAPGTTDCVVGSPVQDHPFAAVYNDVYSTLYTNLLKYDAVVDGTTTFGHYEAENWPPAVEGNHDAIDIGGVRYPVLYMNCSGFVTLLTKGRDYRSSPYYRLFTDPDATARQLASCCLEKGDTNEAPWTYDCLNVLLTWRMAEILRSSGCTPFPVAYKDTGGLAAYDADGLRKLRDGDMLFAGDEAARTDRYKGIYHCMMYFRDLDRLNAAAKAWGNVTLRPFDDGSPRYGYCVHCGASTDGTVRGTQNVLRIETMDRFMQNVGDGVAVWGVRTASNALNSAKLHQSVTGRLVLYDCAVVNAWRHNSDLDTIPINHVESMKEGTQNGLFSYGQYRYSQPNDIVKPGETLDFNDYFGSKNAGVYCFWNTGIHLVNGPTEGNVTPGSAALQTPTTVNFVLEVVDVSLFDQFTLQRVSTLAVSYQRTWERVVNWQGTPGKWREVCDVTQALDAAGKACPADTVSGETAAFSDGADGMFLKSLTAELPPVQAGSGTPAPDNVRPILRLTSFEAKRDDGAGGNGLIGKTDLTAGGSEVYCGKLEQASGKLSLTRRMVTLTGADFTGRGSTSASGKYRFYTAKYADADKDASLNAAKFPVCDRLASIASTDSYSAAKSGICMLGSEQRIYVYLEEMSGYTLAQFKAWVDANPLTVAYTVTDPETVTLPEKVLTTRLGDNRITAKVTAEDGTEVACENITVTYRADPALYIDKKIAALTAAGSEVSNGT